MREKIFSRKKIFVGGKPFFCEYVACGEKAFRAPKIFFDPGPPPGPPPPLPGPSRHRTGSARAGPGRPDRPGPFLSFFELWFLVTGLSGRSKPVHNWPSLDFHDVFSARAPACPGRFGIFRGLSVRIWN